MTAKKVLILYAAIGLGHKSIAENIGFYLTEAGYEVQLQDAQAVQGGFLAVWGKKLYQWMVPRLPFIWSWLYDTQWFISATLPYRTNVAAKNSENILSAINQFKPDLIISTHTTASAIISYLKSQNLYVGKFGITFSDFHLHRFWLYDNADFYLANTEEQKKEMQSYGIAEGKIFVCGMTLKPKMQVDVAQAKAKFGIEPHEKVILLSSGSQGFGVDGNLISKLISKPKIKVLVLCGNNKERFEYLGDKFAGSNATILGYQTSMDEIYAITDLLISKPGGLTTSEALRWNLPIVISHLLPGGEEHNYNYLLDRSLILPEPINIADSALEELQTGSFKKALLQNPELPKLFKGAAVAEAVNQVLK